MARFREVRFWNPESVRKTCIDNGLFTRGSNEEYAYMLNCVHHFKPTLENIEAIARIILRFISIAVSERSTKLSIATPNSVNANCSYLMFSPLVLFKVPIWYLEVVSNQ